MNKTLRNTEISHLILSQFLKEGQTAVDATAGNGYDTLFLAGQIGLTGKVYAFDIQEKALENTRKLLSGHNCLDRVTLIPDGHEKLTEYIKEPVHCLVYNLGYLPGGDKSIITSKATTLLSLKQGLEILTREGIAAITLYPGHPGGAEEAAEVEDYLLNLPSREWHIFIWKRVNSAGSTAPYLIIVNKKEAMEVELL